MAAAHRPSAACQHRHARRRDRGPQRALPVHRRQAGGRPPGPDRRSLPLRRRPLGSRPHQSAASPRGPARAARLRPRPRRRTAQDGYVEGLRSRKRGRRGGPGSHCYAVVRGMGRTPAGGGRGQAAVVQHRADRRRGAHAAAGGRPASRRHQGAGPDARDRRPGVRAHAGSPWCRRAAGHGEAFAGDGGAGHRQRPRQAFGRSTCGKRTLATPSWRC
jgi:hypothetical protein